MKSGLKNLVSFGGFIEKSKLLYDFTPAVVPGFLLSFTSARITGVNIGF